MRSYNDRRSSGNTQRAWDDECNIHEINAKGRVVRPVGFIQDQCRYWIIPDAAKYAADIRKARKAARRSGREFKMPRRPSGFPVMCPRFDIDRECFIDYRDPKTDEGFKASEVLTAKDLKRKGIKVPKTASRDARFAQRSLALGKAIELTPVFDPMFEDFNERADRRTLFHALDRKKASRRLNEDAVGIVQRGGVPWSAWQAIERIGQAVQNSPFDADEGWDLRITMDKNQPAASMWSVVQTTQTPLSKKEKAIIFGKYKLKDGSVVGYDRIMELRAESRTYDSNGKLTKDAKKARAILKDMKVMRPAAIYPLDEMIKEAAIDGEELKRIMLENGYYDEEGNPRPELIREDKKKQWNEDDEDDSDDYDDEEEDSDDYDEDDEPRRRRSSRSSRDKKKKKRRTRTEEDDSGSRRKKRKKDKDSDKKRKKSKDKGSSKKRRRSTLD